MIKEEGGDDATVDDGSVSTIVEGTMQRTQSDAAAVKGELLPDAQYKSKSMVKFSQVQPVSQFSKLKLHTDLRRPPENWLRSDTQFQVHNTWLKGATTQFSSFNMAGTLPGTVGEVDVISASENIKKLLKIPFSKAQVSMAVHRIGRTLLLEELDLYQHLRTATQQEKNWLKEVIYRTMEDERNMSTRRKTNETLQNWNLISKFLHYSIGDTPEETAIPMPAHGPPSTTSSRNTALVQHVPDPPHQITSAKIKKRTSWLLDSNNLDSLKQEVKQPKGSEFARHTLWEFEDLRMLIGSDLPIFGGGKYPAVSLRLRDMNSPINVLTGMDYWLDNLMCNVPEIAMCYHLNGIVKKYELLKTEEIPHLNNAQFSPRVVIDIAQNILSFIKSSCTKEGHTYWLYKGENDDVVKLYDLTSLSMETHSRSQANPFVQPVALLLYRVAHTMSSSQPTKKDKGIICKLLKNCLSLLEKDGNRNPELLASANCLLSHMLVSDDDLGETPEGSQQDSDESIDSCDDDEDDDGDEKVSRLTTIKVDRLMMPSNRDKGQGSGENQATVVPKILWDAKVARAKAALAHIVKGLRCIEYSASNEKDDDLESKPVVGSPSRQLCYPKQTLPDEANPKRGASSTEIVSYTAKRRQIPLQRSSSDGDGSSVDKAQVDHKSASAHQDMSIAQLNHPTGSWQHQSKTLLIRKARQIYSILAVGAVDARDYGKGLHYAKVAFACHYAYLTLQTTDTPDKPNPLSEMLLACGDCHLLITHSPSEFHHHREDYGYDSDNDVYIWNTSRKESESKEYEWAVILNESVELGLKASIQCYIEALNKAKDYANNYLIGVGRKLGNAYNEQGVYYRNAALELDKEGETCPGTEEQDLWRKSYQSFESGILAFEEVNDPANVALLYCNLGQLMRVCAHAYGAYGNATTNGEFTQQEKHYYNQTCPGTEEQDLWRKSYQSFESGILAFEEVNDPANVALLYCNLGQLMRVCAHAYGAYGNATTNGEFTQQGKHYYNQAIDYYQKALGQLEQRRKNKPVWDSISWELSTTYFTMATLLQDHPPLSRMALEQAEKVVLELMTKALSPCEMDDINTDRQPIYQYRAATIHHRLASMYHNSYRNQSSQQKQKHTRSLADLHYDKAIKLFKLLDHPLELLRVQLEKVALYEHIFKGQMGVGSRIKSLQSALNELLHCQYTVIALNKTTLEESNKTHGAKPKEHNSQDVVSVASKTGNKHCGKDKHAQVKCNQDGAIERATGSSITRTVKTYNELDELKSNRDKSGVQDTEERLRSQSASGLSAYKAGDSVQLQVKSQDSAVISSSGTKMTSTLSCECSHTDDDKRTETKDPVSGAKSKVGSLLSCNTESDKTEKGSKDSKWQSCSHTQQKQSEESAAGASKELNEQNKLQSILRSRLQFVLLNLIKLHSGTKKGSLQLSNLKKMYALSLSHPSSDSTCGDLAAANLASILQQIQGLNR